MYKCLRSIFGIIFLSIIVSGSLNAKDNKEKKSNSFAKHSAEIQLTPSVDYVLYQKGDFNITEPYKGRLPFVGFSFGAQYIFRPISVLGISTGVQFRMHGSYSRERVFPYNGNPYIAQRGNAHLNYVSIPLHIHLYKRMKNCTFEFAIGSDFNIPMFTRYVTTIFDPQGKVLVSSKGLSGYSKENMKNYAAFGLSVFMGGVFALGNHGDLFLGPHIQFIDLARFNSDTRKLESIEGRFYNTGLGLKLGFRMH